MGIVHVLVTYDPDARTNVSVHKTADEAYLHLVEFMRTYWDFYALGYIPDDIDALVERYSKEVQMEWSIHPVEEPWLEVMEEAAAPMALPARSRPSSTPGTKL